MAKYLTAEVQTVSYYFSAQMMINLKITIMMIVMTIYLSKAKISQSYASISTHHLHELKH